MEVLLVAGEASADQHAAALVREWKKLNPALHFFGVGGPALAAEGVEITVSAESLNVVGVADWLDRVGEVFGAYRGIRRAAKQRRPAVAVLLDLPDFNLALCKHLKRLGIPVLYYISPQVWAWRRYRVRTIRKYVDRMLVVFPFEKQFYERRGVPVTFVGHPLLDTICARAGLRPQSEVEKAPRIALLPGSRKSELRYHGPVLNTLATALMEFFPQAEMALAVAPTLSAQQVRAYVPDSRVRLDEGNSLRTLEWADLAVVASGTATLETALVGTPFCLFYRMSPSTGFVIRHLIRYRRFFGMPNLLHGKEVVREFLHEDAEAANLVKECMRLVQDAPYRETQAQELRQCRGLLGAGGASERAAQIAQALVAGGVSKEADLVPSPA